MDLLFWHELVISLVRKQSENGANRSIGTREFRWKHTRFTNCQLSKFFVSVEARCLHDEAMSQVLFKDYIEKHAHLRAWCLWHIVCWHCDCQTAVRFWKSATDWQNIFEIKWRRYINCTNRLTIALIISRCATVARMDVMKRPSRISN